jgi:hypothetical protein
MIFKLVSLVHTFWYLCVEELKIWKNSEFQRFRFNSLLHPWDSSLRHGQWIGLPKGNPKIGVASHARPPSIKPTISVHLFGLWGNFQSGFCDCDTYCFLPTQSVYNTSLHILRTTERLNEKFYKP